MVSQFASSLSILRIFIPGTWILQGQGLGTWKTSCTCLIKNYPLVTHNRNCDESWWHHEMFRHLQDLFRYLQAPCLSQRSNSQVIKLFRIFFWKHLPFVRMLQLTACHHVTPQTGTTEISEKRGFLGNLGSSYSGGVAKLFGDTNI